MSGPGRASLKTPSSSLSVGASARAFSDRYATLSLDARDDRPTLETSVFAGAPLGARADLTVQYTHADARDRGSRDLVSAFSSIRLTDRASLFMGVAQSWERGARPSTDAFAGLSTHLSADAVHRPAGLAEDPDGSHYFSNDKAGRIWRVVFKH